MRASGLRGMAWVPVVAKGERVTGGVLADPGGQRVLMLGGRAVEACAGGVLGAGAATAAAPSIRPDIVA